VQYGQTDQLGLNCLAHPVQVRANAVPQLGHTLNSELIGRLHSGHLSPKTFRSSDTRLAASSDVTGICFAQTSQKFRPACLFWQSTQIG
jgi:hypothetical protein